MKPVFGSLLLLFLAALACTPEKNQEEAPAGGLFFQPEHFPPAHYQFEGNLPDKRITNLGRKLFFDPILSVDSTISCESCHKPWAAFSDPFHPLSHGLNDEFGLRNSPAMFNLAWMPEFMWDGGVQHIEIMPFAPITNPVEMGSDLKEVVAKLKRSPEYQRDFENAFGKGDINDRKMFLALAQFMSALISENSPYDQYVKGNKNALNVEELAGLVLFNQNCSQCHKPPLFTNFSFRNNGLAEGYSDAGRGMISLLAEDSMKFKVPSLRNIAYTLPYMHDGRIESLEQVIEHYSSGITAHKQLDPSLPTGGFQFSNSEKQQLLAFLKALSDETFLHQSEFQNPF